MTETYFARIVEVLPSRVLVSIPSDLGEQPILRTFSSKPLEGIIDLRTGNVLKIIIENNPGEVIMRYQPANKSDYNE